MPVSEGVATVFSLAGETCCATLPGSDTAMKSMERRPRLNRERVFMQLGKRRNLYYIYN
jgi:hypothetical protein